MPIAIYLDSGSVVDIGKYACDDRIGGLTCNPTIIRKAGVTNYRDFAQSVLKVVNGKSVSFEVFADDFETMGKQAVEIASWGSNIWVKIPITNTKGESSLPLVERLKDINVNLTAVMTERQIETAIQVLKPNDILSVFVGRVTDTQAAPHFFWQAKRPCRTLWASAREVYSVTLAERYGYDIITLTPDLIAKLPLKGKDLTQYSLETVRQFHEDGKGIKF